MIQRTTQYTNKPFQVLCSTMMFEIPEEISLTVNLSTDGTNFHPVSDLITGPEIVEMGPIVRGTFILLSSDKDFKINIIS